MKNYAPQIFQRLLEFFVGGHFFMFRFQLNYPHKAIKMYMIFPQFPSFPQNFIKFPSFVQNFPSVSLISVQK